MEKFSVTYLKHSIFHDAERKQEIATKTRLIELLQMGMVSVLEVKAIIGRYGS